MVKSHTRKVSWAEARRLEHKFGGSRYNLNAVKVKVRANAAHLFKYTSIVNYKSIVFCPLGIQDIKPEDLTTLRYMIAGTKSKTKGK